MSKFVCVFIVCVLTAEVSPSCKKCFPSGFLWGVATSSYQSEGAWNTSGKGENLWDWYTHTYPERIADRSNGDVAADSYNRYEEDVDLVANVGANVYRFSLSWTRILPDGTVNNINQEGVDYYINLLKKLKAKNIEPLVTIYHWELPIGLHQLGGWTNPVIVDYFLDYATLCYQLFGAYVKYWITVNEPYIHCYESYGSGIHAPGYTQSGTLTYTCFYTQLLAHAKAYRSYNESFKATQNGEVGIVLNSNWFEPLNDNNEDKAAVDRALQWNLGLGAHPIFVGNWPEMVIDRVGNLSAAQGFNQSRLPTLTDKEIELIKGTYDYLGLNYYTTQFATQTPNISSTENTTVSYNVDRNIELSYNESSPQAKSSWLRDEPSGLKSLLKWVSDHYGKPRILITENGWSDARGSLNDTSRINYIKGHLCSVLKAKHMNGVDVFGYTYWSFMNNFEWAAGYTEGFGLIDIDYTSSNLTRTPKASYYYYKQVIETNCIEYCPFK